jgi:hypothetical protein
MDDSMMMMMMIMITIVGVVGTVESMVVVEVEMSVVEKVVATRRSNVDLVRVR